MRTTFLIAFIAGVLTAPSAASACSLGRTGPPPTAKEEVDGSKRAVWGKVVKRTRISGDEHSGEYRYRFRVLETYKGTVREHMRLYAGTEESLCEAGLLNVGDRFGLLLYKTRGPWRITLTSFVSRKRLRESGYPPRR